MPFEAVLKGGFVFYGGLIGGAVGLSIYALMYKLDTVKFFDIYALVLPLGHAIGRIGCFFSGCCYGIEYDGFFSVSYNKTLGLTPLHTQLLPIQLIEAFLLCILFIFLLFVYFKSPKRGMISAIYLYCYSVIRFVLEFFRGDTERGNIFNFSTSQIISMVLILVVSLCWIFKRKKLSEEIL